jgi:hypothetical protein
MTAAPKRRWSFTLRTLLFWLTPWAATCALVLVSCRERMMSPGQGAPLFHWAKIGTVAGITAVWAVLFWENSRAMKRQQRESNPD